MSEKKGPTMKTIFLTLLLVLVAVPALAQVRAEYQAFDLYIAAGDSTSFRLAPGADHLQMSVATAGVEFQSWTQMSTMGLSPNIYRMQRTPLPFARAGADSVAYRPNNTEFKLKLLDTTVIPTNTFNYIYADSLQFWNGGASAALVRITCMNSN